MPKSWIKRKRRFVYISAKQRLFYKGFSLGKYHDPVKRDKYHQRKKNWGFKKMILKMSKVFVKSKPLRKQWQAFKKM
jgi:hypothetical protein